MESAGIAGQDFSAPFPHGSRYIAVALSDIDRSLLQGCLDRQPRSWETFVNRFLGLVIHVVNHSARAKSIEISAEDREDLCSEVFLTILKNDFAVLRAFRGASSLATYLTVIARRVVVRELVRRQSAGPTTHPAREHVARDQLDRRLENGDQVRAMLDHLEPRDAEIIRMYHLEGRSYREIGNSIGIPENSVGPMLSRARGKLREGIE